jgi:hypothetical protein
MKQSVHRLESLCTEKAIVDSLSRVSVDLGLADSPAGWILWSICWYLNVGVRVGRDNSAVPPQFRFFLSGRGKNDIISDNSDTLASDPVIVADDRISFAGDGVAVTAHSVKIAGDPVVFTADIIIVSVDPVVDSLNAIFFAIIGVVISRSS